MQEFINSVLKILKWPLALLMVILFIPSLKTDIFIVQQTINQNFMMNFIVPVIGMIVLWFIIPGLNGSHFSIFEHEFTHMIAALLTFHCPRSMKIESDKGGAFGYYGEGNWFITLAPYFLPTFPLLMMIISLFWTWTGKNIPSLFIPVLGMMFGYHLVSNATQIHGEQTDFPKAGWLFSILFLPTANLITFGFVWAFAARNWKGISSWFHILFHETELFINRIFS